MGRKDELVAELHAALKQLGLKLPPMLVYLPPYRAAKITGLSVPELVRILEFAGVDRGPAHDGEAFHGEAAFYMGNLMPLGAELLFHFGPDHTLAVGCVDALTALGETIESGGPVDLAAARRAWEAGVAALPGTSGAWVLRSLQPLPGRG